MSRWRANWALTCCASEYAPPLAFLSPRILLIDDLQKSLNQSLDVAAARPVVQPILVPSDYPAVGLKDVQGGSQADFFSKLEALGNRSCVGEERHRNPSDPPPGNALMERGAVHPNNLYRKIVEPRRMGPPFDGQPDLFRPLLDEPVHIRSR